MKGDHLNILVYYLIFFTALYIVALLFRKRLNADVYGPILMIKTQKMRNWIDSIAQLSPRFWRWTMNVGVVVAIICMVLALYSIILSLQYAIFTPQTTQAALILPGVDVPGSPVFIPLVSGIIALISVLVIHELAHGIMARADGIGVKSIGVFLITIIPGGAFVELDEKTLNEAKKSSKIRVAAAGSISNFALGLVALLILTIIGGFTLGGVSIEGKFIPYAFETDGLTVMSVTPGEASDGILKEGMVIYSLNGYSVGAINDYNQLKSQIKPGDKFTFVTDQGTYTVTAGTNPNNQSIGYAGIRLEQHLVVKPDVAKVLGNVLPWFLYNLNDVCHYIFALNIMIGLINLLPAKPLDGGVIFEELLGYKIPKRIRERKLPEAIAGKQIPENIVSKISSSFSVVIFGIFGLLIIYNVIPGLMRMF